ncbi:hypothetical protein [Pseudomonas sp. B28(2017)]|uniref:hypothetical protein n=1 Tax=Pseudomonas sp. B28(2017) TaxID=1981730 RepID=UPI00117B1409|nr:hypothetical protein [Pseudomonas sp. B28(2017)]
MPSPVALAVPGGGEVKLKSAFFVSLMTLDAAAEITHYKGALLVAVGTDDDIVSPQPTLGKSFIRYHPGEHELLVRPMDHAFNMTKDEKQIDELISMTATFVKKHIH